jgi:hypothetical protein
VRATESVLLAHFLELAFLSAWLVGDWWRNYGARRRGVRVRRAENNGTHYDISVCGLLSRHNEQQLTSRSLTRSFARVSFISNRRRFTWCFFCIFASASVTYIPLSHGMPSLFCWWHSRGIKWHALKMSGHRSAWWMNSNSNWGSCRILWIYVFTLFCGLE